MKKALIGFLIMLVPLGALLFYDQILAVFHGMTALEAMRTIITFVLHVAVVTILSYVAFTLPEIVKPWMRTLRWKQRQARRSRQPVRRSDPTSTSLARGTVPQWIRLLMQAMGRSDQAAHRRDAPSQDDEPHIRIDF